MASLLMFSIWCLIDHLRASDSPLGMKGHIYKQMDYNTDDSPLAQLSIKNQFVCAAQCAHQFPTCYTAVFHTNVVPQCWLYDQPLRQEDLVVSSNTMVYDFQENKFGATTTTTVSSTSSTSTTASTTTVILPDSGILFNLSPSSLPSGWSLCHSSLYSAGLNPAAVATILAMCYRDNLLLGCRPAGSSTLTVAAMGSRADVLYDCGSTSNCTHVANGVGWYFSNSHSWGFVDGVDAVLRSPCDNSTVNGGSRMCWKIQGGGGGYRCGSTMDLDTDSSWWKIIYHSN